MKNNFIIATHNIHKIKEIATILNFYHQHGEGYRKKLPQQTFPPESTVSYEGNAKEKALFISQQLPAAKIIADDSGLELPAFPGRYGVQTARELAQEVPNGDLNDYLIHLVDGKSRQFIMKTTIALAINNQVVKIGHGQLKGTIAHAERGVNATGFDRIFIPAGESRTLAEMDLPTRISYLHRARAVKNLLDQLGE
ncbi:non-canonical purine NTP pyrophosphatase [Limosilactobacillus reuteri]|uniref:Non-canonical purine NTP pyrophosphatase n=1 Tax=Limosilactobacillus reuteri TaxID=1598 RepID=A0A256VAI6_LIMRT|nr:non-canonical purine NTP pyrophosphatase [Limosilactobacillus reuteri]MCR1863424.1 non-canonical purine NTP pyrophosphatase [Limosilactobacillus reuteri]MCR1892990.1 non-canonical purine NTP pyrophosphatase [Limosilactobacillus reuteri]OYS49931.1 non-canonical purine NTP pyrophosphatase [Limosilactobacillus reuteri]OYS51239.1 non-canonical purine NTP pyrophosphatase [Limosilactobacillus reuteri]OYS51363.1 non-canonical purine NTP pyrophosphatase [Limosilactobacillus reuteri]